MLARLVPYLTSPQVPKHKEFTCALIASLGGTYQNIHYGAALVRLTARLSLDDRLNAQGDSFGVLGIVDRLEGSTEGA